MICLNSSKECSGCMDCRERKDKPVKECTECSAGIYHDDTYYEIANIILCVNCIDEYKHYACAEEYDE